ncbi:hypothetical protein [Pyxidicoccus xibeiensis]|uniref:hypothetical protein n=1 Tax=Pyxidicoccus xibeiensis TaxID=2906759 RepID=UPI0020A830AE|nr:hypothetical protein [Pyxidicoccus xibeiensis]MCP3138116.1 hypothetical protein [Pyxidicoccus xibeiensis]
MKSHHVPWSGYHWPYADGGITDGGNDSPAAKYDRAVGRKPTDDNAITRHVKNHIAKRNPPETWQGWEGLCNGWSDAAMFTKLGKQQATFRGVEFTSSDVKALLAAYYEELQAERYHICTKGPNGECPANCYRGASGNCLPANDVVHITQYVGGKDRALTPEAYHLAATRMMPKRRFVANLSPVKGQIWNYPVIGASFQYEPVTQESGRRFLKVVSTLEVADADTTGVDRSKKKTFGYRLEVNERNQLVRGGDHKWLDSHDHPPAFLWTSESNIPSGWEKQMMREFPLDWDVLLELVMAFDGNYVLRDLDAPPGVAGDAN